MTRVNPNFFVVGAQKCGTTSLHEYLFGHPDIYLPEIKETHFFIDDEHYVKGFDSYLEQHFSNHKEESMVGEVDPDYMYFDCALDRMERHMNLDETKFIFIFRNPVDRAFSQYLMSVRFGHEELPFDQAIKAETDRLKKGFWWQKFFSYITRGYYFQQVSRFVERVDRGQMLFLLNEDMRNEPALSIERILSFLEVESSYLPDNIGRQFFERRVPRSKALLRRIKGQGLEKKFVRLLVPWEGPRQFVRQKFIEYNERKGDKEIMDEATRERLSKLFRPENERLAEFIDRDLSHWN